MFSFFGSSSSNNNENSDKEINSKSNNSNNNLNNNSNNNSNESFNNNSNNKENDETAKNQDSNNSTIRLHKEELDINKNIVLSGEVIIAKEVVEEKKSLEVPVAHEEVVIERKVLNNKATDTPIGPSETIRIPLREEQVQVNKQTVLTEEISAKKREVQENKTIEANLKKEEAKISTNGNPALISKGSESSMN